jgi:hypothetical protein
VTINPAPSPTVFESTMEHIVNLAWVIDGIGLGATSVQDRDDGWSRISGPTMRDGDCDYMAHRIGHDPGLSAEISIAQRWCDGWCDGCGWIYTGICDQWGDGSDGHALANLPKEQPTR